MTENVYLAHHGIKGMRWGVRRYQNDDGSLTNAGKSRYSTGSVKRQYVKDTPKTRRIKREKAIQKEYEDGYSILDDAYSKYMTGLNNSKQQYKSDKQANKKDKYAKARRIERDKAVKKQFAEDLRAMDEVENRYTKALEASKQQYKDEKKARKKEIKQTYKDLNKNASIGEKFVYNNATRKAAAKYIVDNNMPVEEAKKKAKKEAIRNSAIIMAAYGGIFIADHIK